MATLLPSASGSNRIWPVAARLRPRSADPTRFDDAGELEYCLASILRFAPWFRHIHIVTDQQKPALMSKFTRTPGAHRVRVVDHREIFTGYEQHLPAFNSRANISTLWRNSDLAEHFIYFNDDFIVLRHVSPQDFFRGNAVVMRGNWSPQSGYSWSRRVIDRLKNLRRSVEKRDRAGNHATQELSAKRAGFERRYYRLYHNSFPMRRSTLPPPCGGRENWPDPRLAGEEKIGLIPTLQGKGELG